MRNSILSASFLSKLTPLSLTRNPQGDINPNLGQIVMLPQNPMGDLIEEGDYADFEYGSPDGSLDIYEEGDTKPKKTVDIKKLAAKLASGTASASEIKTARTLAASNPAVARALSEMTRIKKMGANSSVLFEHVRGGRILSSDLGDKVKLQPYEVVALQSSIARVIPFSPRQFAFASGVLDIVQSVNSAIGATATDYPGVLITLSAAAQDVNQGAQITVTRKLGLLNAVQQTIVTQIELDSGVNAVKILLLNGISNSGEPRLFIPTVTGDADPDLTFQITITGLPAAYTATGKFLQAGDAEVKAFVGVL
jgi:hypothetical protein